MALALALLNLTVPTQSETFTPLPIWMVTAEAVLILVSVVGNSWIIFKGLSQKALRDSSFHLLLINLSLANLLSSALCYSSFTYKLRIGLSRNDLEVEHCRVSSILLLWFMGVSLFSNCSLAINRALSCHPLMPISAKIRSKKVTLILIASTWLSSLVIYLLPAIILRKSWLYMFTCITLEYVIRNLLRGETLFPKEPAQTVVSWMILSHLMVVLVINMAAYITILKYLLTQHTNNASDQRKKEIRRALVVIVAIFVVLLGCWLPFMVALSIDPILVAKNDVYLFLPAMEAALDPILYMVTMPVFRPQWLGTFCRQRTSGRVHVNTTTSTATHSTRIQDRRGTLTSGTN